MTSSRRRSTRRSGPSPREAARVRAVVLDVDGVLTDGGIWVGADGRESLRFDVRDGHGVRMLREAGIPVAALTRRDSPAARTRCRAMGIGPFVVERGEKTRGLARILRRLGVAPRAVAYLADDLPDLPVLARVGLPCAVADAAPEVRAAARWVSRRPGGRGAVRELAEYLLGQSPVYGL